MVKVSVILPTFNRSHAIKRAIDSVLDQTIDEFELLVVDDGSTDDTVERVKEYNDSRIHVLVHENNLGGSAARNTGISNASGKYIAFIDSDDEWLPKKLERQLELFQDNHEIGAVYSGYWNQYEANRELGEIPNKRGNIFEDQLRRDWVNPTSTVMVRAECIEKVGGFDVTLNARQDYDLWVRISRHYDFDYIAKPLVIRHMSSDDRISDNVKSRMNAHRHLLEKIQDDLNELSWHKRRKSFGSHYYEMGRYLQRHGHYMLALRYYLKSLRLNPINWKLPPAIVLAIFKRNIKGDRFIQVKNILRRISLFSKR